MTLCMELITVPDMFVSDLVSIRILRVIYRGMRSRR